MKELIKKELPLLTIGTQLHAIEERMEEMEAIKKGLRDRLFDNLKSQHVKSLKLDDGTVYYIKEGNRKVVIKDQEKAEKYLDEFNCWKIDSGKLLKIFGKELKVPPFFKIERGEETLAIKGPDESDHEENN